MRRFPALCSTPSKARPLPGEVAGRYTPDNLVACREKPSCARGRAYPRSCHQIYASAASIWEVAINVSLGKIRIDLDEFVAALGESGFQELSVTARRASPIFRSIIAIRSTACWSRRASWKGCSCSPRISSSRRTGLRSLSPGSAARWLGTDRAECVAARRRGNKNPDSPTNGRCDGDRRAGHLSGSVSWRRLR